MVNRFCRWFGWEQKIIKGFAKLCGILDGNLVPHTAHCYCNGTLCNFALLVICPNITEYRLFAFA